MEFENAQVKVEAEETSGVPSEVSTEPNDPYAYLNLPQFSSEGFKIEIKNLPSIYGIGELRKLIKLKLKLGVKKVKTPFPNSPYAFVCFENEDERNRAIEVINGYKWKKKVLTAIRAKPIPDPLVMKQNKAAEKNRDRRCNRKEEKSNESYCDVEYTEQLKMKFKSMNDVLCSYANTLAKNNHYLADRIKELQKLHDGKVCPLEDVKPSPQIKGYRNKCEFTIGEDSKTHLPTVGFRTGKYAAGETSVTPVDNISYVSDAMKKVAKLFEKFVRSSQYKPFDPQTHTGNFRYLTLRTAGDQMMVIVGFHSQDLPHDDISHLKLDLVEFFCKGDGAEADVTSLYYIDVRRRTSENDRPKAQHLMGETHIFETLLGQKFRISPQAFFQVNTSAAEVLYNTAIELTDPTEKSTVIDVCCGTGTIGLCFAKRCGKVLGLEVVEEAIADAKENAKLNGIENAEFFVGKAEEILSSVASRADPEDVIVIVDPPRAGLQYKAISQLRRIKKVDKLVYISCDPRKAYKNWVDLGRPSSKTLDGQPFVLEKAVPVDMFPHTEHCELVLLFKRVT